MRINTSSSRGFFAAVVLAGALANVALWGQTFSSGSTGSDGALSFPTAQPGQTIIFDPTTFNPPLNPAHDNIFNFTTITIPTGVTIKLSAQNLGGPVYWLASGAVDIEGTLDLSGSPGYPPANLIAQRTPSIPGPGGFPGGVGGNGGPTSTYPVEAGRGPGGGITCLSGGSYFGVGGAFTGNQFLVPLIGGSGGAGDDYQDGLFGSGGGAGGGAILIASSVSITINGTITAAGGKSGGSYAGGGAGGAVRLAAPTIQGHGSISVAAGSQSIGGCLNGTSAPQNGIARLEAFNQLFSGSISGGQGSGSPYNTFVPNTGATPKLTVASVNGVAVAPSPLGNFTTPDVTFSASGAVPVVVKGANIPLGTQVSLQIYSENGPDIVVPNGGVLGGTVASSTVTVMVNLPPGFSRGFISASFTP